MNCDKKRKNNHKYMHNNAIFDKNQLKNAKSNITKHENTTISEKELVMLGCWAKALFYVYPSIPNIIKIVDNIVTQRASSVIQTNSIYSCPESSLRQMEKVIDLGERKLRLLNILSLIRELISNLDERSYEIITMKYFNRMKTETISTKLSLEERSVYRRINRAIEKAAKALFAMGFSSDSISKTITGEGWIREIYQKSMEQLLVNNRRAKSNSKRHAASALEL